MLDRLVLNAKLLSRVKVCQHQVATFLLIDRVNLLQHNVEFLMLDSWFLGSHINVTECAKHDHLFICEFFEFARDRLSVSFDGSVDLELHCSDLFLAR